MHEPRRGWSYLLFVAFFVAVPVILVASAIGAGVALLVLPLLLLLGSKGFRWAWAALTACLGYVALWSLAYLGQSLVAFWRGVDGHSTVLVILQLTWALLVLMQVRVAWRFWCQTSVGS